MLVHRTRGSQLATKLNPSRATYPPTHPPSHPKGSPSPRAPWLQSSTFKSRTGTCADQDRRQEIRADCTQSVRLGFRVEDDLYKQNRNRNRQIGAMFLPSLGECSNTQFRTDWDEKKKKTNGQHCVFARPMYRNLSDISEVGCAPETDILNIGQHSRLTPSDVLQASDRSEFSIPRSVM